MAASVKNDYPDQMIKTILQLGEKHSTWQVFEDFLTLSAISISNSVDSFQFEKREDEYLKIIKKYDKSEAELFPKLFAMLVMELEKNAAYPKDILGELFHKLGLHNKYKGQFFTPNYIANLMGKMSLSEQNNILENKEFITVCEPCTGSGTLVLGFANAMAENKLDFQRKMIVTATDIDIKCVYMSYIQFSLYGIPAVVVHGNSLTVEEWSHWFTPIYIMHGWQFKKEATTDNIIKMEEIEPLKKVSGDYIKQPIIPINTIQNEQLRFF